MKVFQSEQLQTLFDSLRVDPSEDGTAVMLDSARYIATCHQGEILVGNKLHFKLPPFDALKEMNADLSDSIRDGVIEYNQLEESGGVITQKHLQHRKDAFISIIMFILETHSKEFIVGLEGHPPPLQLFTINDIHQLEEMRMEIFGGLN